MKTIGLCGKSGTGKSFRATELAAREGADGIIDDGLLIADGQIVAGVSAKGDKTIIGAVKTAVFTEDSHAEDVIFAIQKSKLSCILILGTSDRMIYTIAERLMLPKPDKIINIEDITTEKERAIAKKLRTESGMHTIPAPTLQVKRRFSGYFIDAKRSFKKKSEKAGKTVIRPTYSYLGSYEISGKVISQIAEHIAEITSGCSKFLFATSTNTADGMYIRVIINVERGYKVKNIAETLQSRIYNATSYMTSFNILGVEIEVRGYTLPEKRKY